MYSASVPVFKQLLSALNDILVKAASGSNNEINPETLITTCPFIPRYV